MMKKKNLFNLNCYFFGGGKISPSTSEAGLLPWFVFKVDTLSLCNRLLEESCTLF